MLYVSHVSHARRHSVRGDAREIADNNALTIWNRYAQRSVNPDDAAFRGDADEIVLPDSKHSPARGSKRPCDESIPRFVGVQFRVMFFDVFTPHVGQSNYRLRL